MSSVLLCWWTDHLDEKMRVEVVEEVLEQIQRKNRVDKALKMATSEQLYDKTQGQNEQIETLGTKRSKDFERERKMT
nr:hypothetical protein [Tanacetum cinerariifolium]